MPASMAAMLAVSRARGTLLKFCWSSWTAQVISVCSEMTYAKALPLYGLRQNIFTDPQKPMKVCC